jgi:transcriptional regulator with XRE-family HTH domain
MFAIGDSLREARTRRGLSAADVQKGLRIRERYLTALEEERWELLPGDAYTKGFLRTYAEFLGLDGNLYIDEYNTRVSHAEEDRPIVPQSLVPAHRGRRSLLRTLMVLLVVGGVIAGFAALGMGGGGSPPIEPLSNTPNASAPKHAAGATPALAAPTRSSKPPAAAQTRLTVISAPRGRCWLSIRRGGPSGTVVYEGVLEQGRSLHLALGHDLWVRMGRPDAIDISLGGHLVNGLPAVPANVLLTSNGARSA